MYFTKSTTVLSPGKDRLTLSQEGRLLSFEKVLSLWTEDPSFRKFYWQTLIEHGSEGCFWEHPRLNQQTAGRPYECVITRTKAFGAFSADQRPFDDVFDLQGTVSCFINLSGSAWLIAPNPVDDQATDCRDLISFCRSAPEKLLHGFWIAIGGEVTKAIASDSDFQYLSTHGLGVLWLHVRLERRPKYYHHKAYKL